MFSYPFLRKKLVWNTLVKIRIKYNTHTTKLTSEEILLIHKIEIVGV